MMDHKRRLSACGETLSDLTGLKNWKVKIKTGRDSPLIESRPAFSLAVGIVLGRLYRHPHLQSVHFRTLDGDATQS